MKTVGQVPPEIYLDVETTLLTHAQGTVAAYREAERIRKRWADKNVALEDILALIVQNSGKHGVSVAFDPSEASQAMLGPDLRMN